MTLMIIDPAAHLEHLLHSFVSPEPNSGCWIWTGSVDRHGYGRLKRNGRNIKAHRFIKEAIEGPIPANLCVLHKCDLPCCVNPTHVFVGTQADNMSDMQRKGRHKFHGLRGIETGAAKLSEEQALDILSKPNAAVAELARHHGVCAATVYGIRSGRVWAWLPRLKNEADHGDQ